MLSSLVIFFVALHWNPTFTWRTKPQTWHFVQAQPLPGTGERWLLLYCMLCSCCHGLVWGAPFHSNGFNSRMLIQIRVIFRQKEKHKTHTQMLVYNLVGVAFSPCQGTSLVKTLHGHFSNPSLTTSNKLHLLTSCRDPVQSIPNNVRTT